MLKLKSIKYFGVVYYPSNCLSLVPQVFICEVPSILKQVTTLGFFTPQKFYMPGPTLKVDIYWEKLDLALVVRYPMVGEHFFTYHQDDFGWNIKGVNWKEIQILHYYQHNYSRSRGYTFTIGPSHVWGSLRSLKRFLIIGALNIRRIYEEGIIYYMPGPVMEMGIVPWVKPATIHQKWLSIQWKLHYKKLGDNLLFERFRHYKFYNLQNLAFVYEDLLDVVKTLQSINLSRGYVLSENIFEYPIIKEFACKFIDQKDYFNLNGFEKGKVYTWLLNILFLHIYKFIIQALANIKRVNCQETNPKYQEFHYLKARFSVLGEYIHSLFENVIKQHLVVRSIKIRKEINAGFDTEYTPVDFGENKLLSAQLSVTGLLKLIVPINSKFIFEGMNTMTSERYFKSSPRFTTPKVDTYINTLILKIREILVGDYDTHLKRICTNFIHNDSNIDNICRNEFGYSFSFTKKPIVNKIILPLEKEDLKISLQTLVVNINNSINLDEDVEKLLTRLNAIYTLRDYNDNYSKETPSWNSKTMKTLKPEIIFLSNEENSQEYPNFKKDTKRLLNTIHLPLPVLITKNINVYGHYNSADFSMLENWDKIKIKNIDLLKKSYISLKAPINILNEKVFIKDTSLLASAVANNLNTVGKAHGLNKVEIPKYFIQGRMHELLKTNTKLFLDYAIQDSLITLIHALFMNDFAFKLGSNIAPNTLGSLATKYLLKRWKKDNYHGYQVDFEYPLGDAQRTHTPKGISSLGIIGETLNSFLASYKGGRNECFAYGIDENTKWYDYDLTSCYSTVMSMCGDPVMENTNTNSSPVMEMENTNSSILSSHPGEGEGEEKISPTPSPEISGQSTEERGIGTEILQQPRFELAQLAEKGESGCYADASASAPAIAAKVFAPSAPKFSDFKLTDNWLTSTGDYNVLGTSTSTTPKSVLVQKSPTPTITRVWTGKEDLIKPMWLETVSEKIPEIPETVLEKTPMILSEESTEEEELSELAPNILPLCGNPDYNEACYINPYNLKQLNLKNSYSAVNVSFKLPPSIKYPPIPVTLDKNITIYPLSGTSIITGLEYLSAINILNQELYNISRTQFIKLSILREQFFIKVSHGVYIPFKLKKGELENPPFYNVINDLQQNRRKWAAITGKKSAMERIYKDLGNMLYGKVVCGISNKRSFNSRLNIMTAMTGSELTNPMIGAWITGFVRSLLAELLFYTDKLGGKVCSVTTDGFVTNIENLENKILEYIEQHNIKNSFLSVYRNSRNDLTNGKDSTALEIKTSVKGLIQWTTRGQCSLENSVDSPIIAMTGFQKHLFSINDIISALRETIGNGNKLTYLQNRLTGALDNYQKGSQVSMLSSLRAYRTVFDTKRLIIFNEDNTMLFSEPFENIQQAAIFRILMNKIRNSIYSHEYTDKNTFITSCNSKQEVLKYFIRLALCDYKVKNVWSIVELIIASGITIPESEILRMIAKIELKPSAIMNKLNINEKTLEYAQKLYHGSSICENELSINLNKVFREIFLSKFSNLISVKVPSSPYVPASPPLALAIIPTFANLSTDVILTTNILGQVLRKVKIPILEGIPQIFVEKLLLNLIQLIPVPVKDPIRIPVTIPIIPIIEEEVKEVFNTGTLSYLNFVPKAFIPELDTFFY